MTMISASWKTLSTLEIESAAVSLEEELAAIASREIQLEIDNSILASVYKENGWISVIVDPWVHSMQSEINGWCATHLSEGYFQYGNTWLFKEPKDATMFTLRWS